MTTSPRLEALARVGRALADPTRCRLLLALLDGPAYPADLAAGLGLSRATVSNHLACARGCGLVVGVPEGRRVRYELADHGLAEALEALLQVVQRAGGCAAEAGSPARDVALAGAR